MPLSPHRWHKGKKRKNRAPKRWKQEPPQTTPEQQIVTRQAPDTEQKKTGSRENWGAWRRSPIWRLQVSVPAEGYPSWGHQSGCQICGRPHQAATMANVLFFGQNRSQRGDQHFGQHAIIPQGSYPAGRVPTPTKGRTILGRAGQQTQFPRRTMLDGWAPL